MFEGLRRGHLERLPPVFGTLQVGDVLLGERRRDLSCHPCMAPIPVSGKTDQDLAKPLRPNLIQRVSMDEDNVRLGSCRPHVRQKAALI